MSRFCIRIVESESHELYAFGLCQSYFLDKLKSESLLFLVTPIFKLSINQSINLFICFVLQNEKYTNICEKKFSKAQEGSEMTIRSSSQLPPSKYWDKIDKKKNFFFLYQKNTAVHLQKHSTFRKTMKIK